MILSNPPRVVIDTQSTRLEDKNIASDLSFPGVKSFRIAQRRGAVVRIVIETDVSYNCRTFQPMSSRSIYAISLPNKNAKLPKISQITHSNKSKHRNHKRSQHKTHKHPAVVDEYDEESPYINNEVDKLQLSTTSRKEKSTLFSSIFGKSSRKATSKLKKRYTVVVDPGHGGHDSGAIGSRRYYEKVLVLQIGKRVARLLQKRNFKVIMTRSSDKFIKLRHRTKFANRYKSDIFVSIHANAVANRRRARIVHGVETYYLQTTRSAKAMRIAAKENSVVLNKNDRLSNNVILQSVLSGPKIELSHKLAIDVQSNILRNLRKKYRGVKDGGVKPAPFWVLVGAQMPSILVEVGYITNPSERARLFSPKYQNRIAKGIADGVSNYLAIREREFN